MVRLRVIPARKEPFGIGVETVEPGAASSLSIMNPTPDAAHPNTPVVKDAKITARLFYDTADRQTNTSIPDPETQKFRNTNDPANGEDPFGNACEGQ